MNKKSLFIVCLFILLFGCKPVVLKEPVIEDVEGKFFRGTVYLEDGSYRFKPCGSSVLFDINDNKKVLTPFFDDKTELFASRFIEFEGVLEESRWRILSIYFTSDKPANCKEALQSAHYFISSFNGDWNAVVDEKEVSIVKKDVFSTLVFADESDQSDKREGKLITSRGEKYEMSLVMTDKQCVDHDGNWYRMSANLSLNHFKGSGCVRKLLPIVDYISGSYSNLLAIDNAFIVLELDKNGAAKLIFDYRNGHPIIVTNGQWIIRSKQILELSVNADDSQIEQSVMLFSIKNNQSLVLKGFSDLLGNAGVEFLPVFN